jgi:hypothetical protein
VSLGSWQLQRSIYNRLSSDTTLGAVVTGVFDDIPQGTAFPYVQVGQETITDIGGKDYDARSFLINVDIFSRYHGTGQVKQIADIVVGLIHEQSLTVSGQKIVSIRLENSPLIIRDPKDNTRHGVLRFRVLMVTADDNGELILTRSGATMTTRSGDSLIWR